MLIFSDILNKNIKINDLLSVNSLAVTKLLKEILILEDISFLILIKKISNALNVLWPLGISIILIDILNLYTKKYYLFANNADRVFSKRNLS